MLSEVMIEKALAKVDRNEGHKIIDKKMILEHIYSTITPKCYE